MPGEGAAAAARNCDVAVIGGGPAGSTAALLAGDVFETSRIRASLFAFKALFYLMSLAGLRRSVLAWRQRRLNIRDADASSAGP